MITMRLFAEENARGRLSCSDFAGEGHRSHPGKMARGGSDVRFMLLTTVFDFVFMFKYGNPDWKPVSSDTWASCSGRGLLAIGHLFPAHRTAKYRWRRDIRCLLMLWVLEWVSQFRNSTGRSAFVYVIITHFESFSKGVLDSKA